MAHPFSPTRTEVAPMLTAVWGPLAPTVAALIKLHPHLGRRLALSPAWAIHSTAAYIEAMLAVGDPLDKIACSIVTHHARDLLAEAVPNAHVRLPSALKRIGDKVLELGFYRGLNELLHGPAAEAVLSATAITAGLLSVAEMIAVDPVLMAAHRAIDVSSSDARSLAEYDVISGR